MWQRLAASGRTYREARGCSITPVHAFVQMRAPRLQGRAGGDPAGTCRKTSALAKCRKQVGQGSCPQGQQMARACLVCTTPSQGDQGSEQCTSYSPGGRTCSHTAPTMRPLPPRAPSGALPCLRAPCCTSLHTFSPYRCPRLLPCCLVTAPSPHSHPHARWAHRAATQAWVQNKAINQLSPLLLKIGSPGSDPKESQSSSTFQQLC